MAAIQAFRSPLPRAILFGGFLLGLAAWPYLSGRFGGTAGEERLPEIPSPALPELTSAGEVLTYRDALAELDAEIAHDRQRADRSADDWVAIETLANSLAARGQLTGSFDDFVAADRLLARAFAVSGPKGPNLSRAALNFSLHRLARIEADLAAIEDYALKPDIGARAAIEGMRGDIAFYAGRYGEARTRYERSHAMARTLRSTFRLANYHGKTGDPDAALAYLAEAERFTGGARQARSFLELHRGIIALDRGRWPEAERHFRRADSIFPGHWLIEEHLAEVTLLQGRVEEARRLYEGIVERTGNPEFMDALAALHEARGETTLAAAWALRAGALWRQRLRMLPEAAYGHALDHYLQFGDSRRALAIAQRNAKLRPFGEAQIGLARAWLKLGRAREAREAIEAMLESGWTTADGHVAAHEVYAALGEDDLAREQREKALAINPHAL